MGGTTGGGPDKIGTPNGTGPGGIRGGLPRGGLPRGGNPGAGNGAPGKGGGWLKGPGGPLSGGL